MNEEIWKNLEIQTDIMNIEDALASGALAFFGDKYPEANVRVVTIPDAASPRGFYSKELCGGTHLISHRPGRPFQNYRRAVRRRRRPPHRGHLRG